METKAILAAKGTLREEPLSDVHDLDSLIGRCGVPGASDEKFGMGVSYGEKGIDLPLERALRTYVVARFDAYGSPASFTFET